MFKCQILLYIAIHSALNEGSFGLNINYSEISYVAISNDKISYAEIISYWVSGLLHKF